MGGGGSIHPPLGLSAHLICSEYLEWEENPGQLRNGYPCPMGGEIKSPPNPGKNEMAGQIGLGLSGYLEWEKRLGDCCLSPALLAPVNSCCMVAPNTQGGLCELIQTFKK